MDHRVREIMKSVHQELARYPVEFSFGDGGKHPYVLIKTQDGREKKITYSGTPRTPNMLKVRGDLRRALDQMGVEPWPEERRACRLGTLGAALLDAADATPTTSEPDHTKDNPMTSPIPTQAHAAKSNGNGPAPAVSEYAKLKQGEIVQLTLLITEHAKVDYAAKTVEFAPDWSDARLFEMLRSVPGREKLTLGHVVNFRAENFGRLSSERDTPPEGRSIGGYIAGLKKAVSSLEDRVRALEDAITSPKKTAH